MQDNPALPAQVGERLSQCAAKVGGKRALAQGAGISEAQLFRYINGESEMGAGKLMALAKAAGVSVQWLLTGENSDKKPQRPEYDPNLMSRIIQVIEEYMFEYPTKFNPKHRGQFISLVYDALRHEEAALGITEHWGREDILNMLDFGSALKQGDDLAAYHRIFEAREIQKQTLSHGDCLRLERMVKLGLDSLYNGISGRLYFDRMGLEIYPETLKALLELVAQVTSLVQKREVDWLDLGCGNGRFMLPLVKHAPHLKLMGVDPSSIAAQEMQKHIQVGHLPPDCFRQAYSGYLPFEADSFDCVYSRVSLFHLPRFEHFNGGFNQALSEVTRVLRPGGIFHLMTPAGEGRRWLPFAQYTSEEELRGFLDKLGFEILSFQNLPVPVVAGYPMQVDKDYSPRMGSTCQVVTARKPRNQ